MTTYIGRRKLLAALSGAAAAWPLGTRAQQPTMPMIGYLSYTSAEYEAAALLPAFLPSRTTRNRLRRGAKRHDRIPLGRISI
jgi:hypothetical protein